MLRIQKILLRNTDVFFTIFLKTSFLYQNLSATSRKCLHKTFAKKISLQENLLSDLFFLFT